MFLTNMSNISSSFVVLTIEMLYDSPSNKSKVEASRLRFKYRSRPWKPMDIKDIASAACICAAFSS